MRDGKFEKNIQQILEDSELFVAFRGFNSLALDV